MCLPQNRRADLFGQSTQVVNERVGPGRRGDLLLPLRLDNGPEFLAGEFVAWCESRGIALRYIQPGKPNQNAFVERFNRTYRHEVLNAFLFEDLDQVREITDQWLRSYNEERPHDALGNLTPAEYREKLLQARTSTLELSS